MVIILPNKSTYARIDSTFSWGWKFKYGSKYSATDEILCNVTDRYNAVQRTISAGSGFQLIEAIDVDGDGVDEVVKINNSCDTRDVTDYTITIYTFNTFFNYSSRSFSVSVNDGTHNTKYVNPAKSFYRFGNFKGDGTTQLLIMTKPSSKFALVDLNTEEKLSESTLFTLGSDEDNLILAADFENDGKTDLCHITDSGMGVYSLELSNSTSFSLRTTYNGVTKQNLYRDIINGIPVAADKAQIYTLDLNGDGYSDIASAPISTSSPTDHYSDRWNFARFNGKTFSIDTASVMQRRPMDSVVFLDIDEDGLPDMLHLRDSLFYIPNINGLFAQQHYYTNVKITANSDLIPGDCSLFRMTGDVVVYSGPHIYLYTFGLKHSIRRSLNQMTDSYGIQHKNVFLKTGSALGAYVIDPGRTYSTANGFSRLRAPLQVLSEEYTVDSSNNLISHLFHTYWDEIYHTRGLGFCGFGKEVTRDAIRELYYTSVFDPERFGVTISSSIKRGPYGIPFSVTTNTYDSHTTTYGKLNPRLTNSTTNDSVTGIISSSSYGYNNFDHVSTLVNSKSIGGGPVQTEIISRTYINSLLSTKYVLGAINQEIRSLNTDGVSSDSWREKTLIAYDANYNRTLVKKYVGPSPDDHLISTTRRTYDSRGNVTSEKTVPYDATEFVGDTLVYDANGRYLVSKTDALGHTTTYSGYNKFGKPTSVTDYRNRTTTYTYDSWGNLTQVSHPDGGVEQTTTSWGGDGLYTVTQTATGSPETITHYDALGREIKSGVKRFDGVWQWTNREYDGWGRLSRVSLPYRATTGVTGPSYWNTYHYDIYDRPDSLCEASGRRTRWSYNGTSVTTEKDSIAITKTTDAMGRVVSVSDLGGTTTYALRDDGQPSSITAPGSVVTTFTYDDYGRQTQMVDPSLGTETDSYTWNTDGSSQFTHTNRNGTVTTYKDKYGRTTQIQRANEFNTTYSYDTYGRLSSVSSTNSTSKEYTYDSYDRIATFKESVPYGKWLQKTYTYSTGGVLSSIAYTSQSGYITTETYAYANGHNTGITIPGTPGGNNITVWSLVSENDLGRPTEITTGGISREYGYTAFGLPTYRKMDGGYIQNFSFQFDPKKGNLLQRSGYLYNYTETFGYDGLNRLTEITKGNTTRQIVYANNGNITSIDGVGTLIYGGGTGVSPYEVTGLTPEQGQPSYRQRTVTYNSFDRPSYVVENTMDYPEANFYYNADGERVFADIRWIDGTLHWQAYAGGRYEHDDCYGSVTERLYLGGDAYSAPMVLQKAPSGSWTLYNIGRDYLGSITHITDAAGANIIAQYRYDPWGRLVDPSTGTPYAPGNEPTLFLGRGFTSHEHLTKLGIIYANARLYDPLLGRFLSPDPYVQDPDFSQNYNRYSYCLNNPLKYTDESGCSPGSTVTAIWSLPQFMRDGLLKSLDYLASGDFDFAKKTVQTAWSNYTKRLNNAVLIDNGLYQIDTNLSEEKQAMMLTSRFDSERMQTILGYWLSIVFNNLYDVDIQYYHGATLVNRHVAGRSGVTLGPYINGKNLVADAEYDDIFAHEYGHTVQSRRLGSSYLFAVGAPSLISAWLYTKGLVNHDHQWYEVQANHLSAEYFKDIKMPNVRAKLEGSTKLSMTFSPDWYYYLSGSFLWANIYFQY